MTCSLEEREDDTTLFVPGRETEDDMASGDVTQAQANGIVQVDLTEYEDKLEFVFDQLTNQLIG
ncbi:hypothetical protein HanOQP8_Chr10g0366081 [Helianthus annuus]|nr:hypothetical protein HanOQP8_Chr10g0366081 [Helianthus annuus]KAJ0883789.1 hypothetical protein HanPSC8_Chr10g0425801 [Helianthus annuus]